MNKEAASKRSLMRVKQYAKEFADLIAFAHNQKRHY